MNNATATYSLKVAADDDNCLGHLVASTTGTEEALIQCGQGRIIFDGHWAAAIPFEDLKGCISSQGWLAYALKMRPQFVRILRTRSNNPAWRWVALILWVLAWPSLGQRSTSGGTTVLRAFR